MSESVAAVQVECVSKEEAAERLGLSERRVLEYIQSGALRAEQRYNSTTKAWGSWVHAGDVERLRDERATPRAKKPAPTKEIAIRKKETALGATGPAISAAGAPATGRAWLTLDEGEAYTGLPAAFLLRLIRSSALRALDVGVRAGGRLRVKRSDLDSIGGNFHNAQTIDGSGTPQVG
jgi:hypothetical protein